MSANHNPTDSPYYLRLFLAELESGAKPKAESRFPADKSSNSRPESVLARGLAARALESYLGYKPSPEILGGETRTHEGKPYFQDYPDFHYNISHSGKYVVCGIICGGKDPQPIGVDIQEIPADPKRALMIADHFFSDEEKESLHALVRQGDISSALLLFCRYWTARESYIKLTGRGVAEPFSNFKPNLDHGRIITSEIEKEVYLMECKAPDGYCLSVCSYVPLEPCFI